ncbi:hypothetical protein DH2020_019806 [Rehmannia glutinosa]|uniref:Aminotransferase-like plant mobile domain-containing protein n=1 Tax=Rehmannia glutinosa TaxID=99300 RepID=A0ABR0WEA4_REHGL
MTNRLHLREWSREIPPVKDSKSKMWALEATHHQQSDEPISLPTLGRCIIEGEAKWGDPIRFGGEFHYVKVYWEWTEDILSPCKNKLQAARIYDSVYASLFIYDCNSNIVKAFCEAWCPSTNTLLTFYGELSISSWDLHTLAGLFLPRSCNRLLHAYHLLQGSAHGDHYLQVSIDDWINFWFKKATKYDPPPMRKERKPPPRKEKQTEHPESTHNPLGDIGVHGERSPAEKALFSKLVWQGTNGPKMAIFSGEGHVKYYEPKEARRRIHKGDWISWTCTMITKNKDFHYVDNGNAQKFEQEYFIAIRSSYLSLRQGGRFVIEPYNPHRFSRQFRCDVLGVEVCESNKRKVAIPSFEESSSSDADHHWKRFKKTHGSLEQQEANGVSSNQPLTENFVEEVSEKFIRNHQQEYLQKLWGDLREKISNIPIDSLSSIQDEVMIVLESMKNLNIIDISFVERSLKDLFAEAVAYDEVRSSSSVIVSKELLAKQLSEVEDRLHDAKTKEAKESAWISSTKEELESINRELDNLRKRKKNLTASLKRQEELLHIAHTEVQQIEDEIVAIQNTPSSNDEILEKLELSTVRLEAAKEELKSLRPFDLFFYFMYEHFFFFEDYVIEIDHFLSCNLLSTFF